MIFLLNEIISRDLTIDVLESLHPQGANKNIVAASAYPFGDEKQPPPTIVESLIHHCNANNIT